MSFTEIRFPENISYGSTGGPEFSTDVVIPILTAEQTDGQQWKKSHNEVSKIVEV